MVAISLPHILGVSFCQLQTLDLSPFENYTTAGQEMLDYLRGQITDLKAKTGNFVLDYDGKRYQCRVTVDRLRNPERAEVNWT